MHCTALRQVVRPDKSRSLLFTFLCLHIPQHVAASPFSVFATFRCSDGRTAERAAEKLDYMVESRMLHGYSLALSTTLSPTGTSWCVFHVDCTALALHTRVERHSAFKLLAQPAVATQFYYLSFSVGPAIALAESKHHTSRGRQRSE